MNWYLAKLVYQIICGDGNHTAQFDEQLRIVYAADELHAFTKAQSFGCREQETFYNDNEKLVQWKFIDVCELHCIENVADGAEIYSRINEQDNAGAYIHIVQMKASNLFAKTSASCLQKN